MNNIPILLVGIDYRLCLFAANMEAEEEFGREGASGAWAEGLGLVRTGSCLELRRLEQIGRRTFFCGPVGRFFVSCSCCVGLEEVGRYRLHLPQVNNNRQQRGHINSQESAIPVSLSLI